MGYDGGRSFLNLGKQITSIDQQPHLTAKAIVDIIEHYYKNTNSEPFKITPVQLVIGETT